MSNQSAVIIKYLDLLDSLEVLNKETNRKILTDKTDTFVKDNQSFFTKSFTITLCAYLESYLKDIAMEIVDEVNRRLEDAKVPHNLVKWSILKKKELVDSELKYGFLSIEIKRRELDQFISGNPERTISLFKKIGLDLLENQDFKGMLPKIGSIVDRRNNILHHNDSASDITFADVKDNIDFVKAYISLIDKAIMDFLKV